MVTREEIEAARTPKGGWTRAQLEAWGVPWPPTKDWRDRIAVNGYEVPMRLNNRSARLIANELLIKSGRPPLSADLSYEQFATELRAITAKTVVQVVFQSREDAVAYIRLFAKGGVKLS